jgi:hypothetical protein
MIGQHERLIPLTEAGKHACSVLPPPHSSTWVRWALRGVGKPRIRLETKKCGGRRYTSREAIERFFSRLTGAEEAREVAVTQRREEFASAEEELDREGV